MLPDDWWEPYQASVLEMGRAEPDWARHASFLGLAVKAGDLYACYAVGSLWLHGSDSPPWPRDRRKGLLLLRRASKTVHMAMLEMASIVEFGRFGVKRSERSAFYLFKRAAESGSVAGRFHLARCYYFGTGTKTDRARAARLFRDAQRLGFPVDGMKVFAR